MSGLLRPAYPGYCQCAHVIEGEEKEEGEKEEGEKEEEEEEGKGGGGRRTLNVIRKRESLALLAGRMYDLRVGGV